MKSIAKSSIWFGQTKTIKTWLNEIDPSTRIRISQNDTRTFRFRILGVEAQASAEVESYGFKSDIHHLPIFLYDSLTACMTARFNQGVVRDAHSSRLKNEAILTTKN